jgi:hypothetical protein
MAKPLGTTCIVGKEDHASLKELKLGGRGWSDLDLRLSRLKLGPPTAAVFGLWIRRPVSAREAMDDDARDRAFVLFGPAGGEPMTT